MSEINEIIKKALHEHHVKVEKLTADQLAEAVRQAIESGDFKRCVQVRGGLDHAQAVYYIPYAEVQSLKSKLAIAVSALEFYATGRDKGLLVGVENLNDQDVYVGERARQALKEIGGGS